MNDTVRLMLAATEFDYCEMLDWSVAADGALAVSLLDMADRSDSDQYVRVDEHLARVFLASMQSTRELMGDTYPLWAGVIACAHLIEHDLIDRPWATGNEAARWETALAATPTPYAGPVPFGDTDWTTLERVMRAAPSDDIAWRTDPGNYDALLMYVNLSDTFARAGSDCEPVDADSVADLELACQQAGALGTVLYAARRRSMRPLPHVLRSADQTTRNHFDAACRKSAHQEEP